MKYHENQSSGNRVVPFRSTEVRTDRHDEVKNRFLQSFESAQKPVEYL